MPKSPRRACASPRCPGLAERGVYCPACIEAGRSPERKAWRTSAGSASSRGYGSTWRRLRAIVLGRNPICVLCGRAPATEVDHRVPKAQQGPDDLANLQAVCGPCHDAKSAAEGSAGVQAKRRAARRPVRKP
jgi:5-methylcytosine-specific restriction enzyme A